jgi:cellulose synthase/poly-beta-1,6-N-acetylglucosamine synthase-like glycosyltransferase
MHVLSNGQTNKRRRRLALVLPGHNEELIMATTIRSAVSAGLNICDIYVVDDDSSDRTRQIALKLLSKKNVLTVARSGKARAVKKAIEYFKLTKHYTWVHIADADSVFCQDYFKIFCKHLNAKKFSVAVGFVQSLHGNWLTIYRSFCYTYGQHILKRLQSWLGIIAVLPGPVTCFKSDIIKYLDFETESLTEDFDLTLQIHRKRLGQIRFIPDAINYTQDPRTMKDFINQTLRWQRGFFQGLRKYRIGLKPHKIDLGIGYQILESLYYVIQIFAIVLLIVFASQNVWILIALLVADFIAVVVLAILSAILARRPTILISLPYFYLLRFLELGIFMWAFIEVIILGKFRKVQKGWQTEGRRYEIAAQDMGDMK